VSATGQLRVDINSDVGESFGAFVVGDDERVMASVTSVNVAAGFHGGDPRTIEAVVHRAKQAGIGVGAHPGFPDLVGFGRRDMRLTAAEIRTDVLYQIGAVYAFTRAVGLPLQHVKPHGQLNNMAVRDRDMAVAIVEAVKSFDRGLVLMSYGGELTAAALEAGVPVAHEVFADREYTAEGTLVSRSQPGAVIHDTEQIAERAVRMVREGVVTAITGETIQVRPDTICVHADTPGAGAIAGVLRASLETAGIRVVPMGNTLTGLTAG
jgi:UPF0271 protein